MTTEQANALGFLARCNASMVSRSAIRITGHLAGGFEQTIMGIINEVKVESGSGLSFIVKTADDHVMYVNVNKHVQV